MIEDQKEVKVKVTWWKCSFFGYGYTLRHDMSWVVRKQYQMWTEIFRQWLYCLTNSLCSDQKSCTYSSHHIDATVQDKMKRMSPVCSQRSWE